MMIKNMKKIIIFVMTLFMMSFIVSADEGVLLDFGKTPPAEFFAWEDWDVSLNSSSQNVKALLSSYAKTTESTENGQVFGVRILFPQANSANTTSFATIKPPYEIPLYDEAFRDSLGVLTNVGNIKSIAVTVYGHNYDYSLRLILSIDGKRKEIPMGSLKFEGWKTLIWNDPAYISDARKRVSNDAPLYPKSSPIVKFLGFEIDRKNSTKTGGDFVVYFKDVKMIYDKFSIEKENDIDDEATWGLNSVDAEAAKARDQEILRSRKAKLETEKALIASESW
jgi:hypothetical protein